MQTQDFIAGNFGILHNDVRNLGTSRRAFVSLFYFILMKIVYFGLGSSLEKRGIQFNTFVILTKLSTPARRVV